MLEIKLLKHANLTDLSCLKLNKTLNKRVQIQLCTHEMETSYFSRHLLKQNLYNNYKTLHFFLHDNKDLGWNVEIHADTVSTMVFLIISPKFSS